MVRPENAKVEGGPLCSAAMEGQEGEQLGGVVVQFLVLGITDRTTGNANWNERIQINIRVFFLFLSIGLAVLHYYTKFVSYNLIITFNPHSLMYNRCSLIDYRKSSK